ncbi:MAG: hypothetical protein HYR88_17475 [Verrucomicrobia bacterium]|nr:hypothetical protein [Verrucomicrobiota bacterium]
MASGIARSLSFRFRLGGFMPILAASLASFAQAAEPRAFELRDGDRVAFVGDTLLEREGAQGWIEQALTSAFPERSVSFRNLAWSADLPTGQSRASFDWTKGEEHWFTNLIGQIAAVKPTVVVLGYGMASSFAGASGIESFTRQMERLIGEVHRLNSNAPPRLVILGPIRHEDLGEPLPDPSSHNLDLQKYTAALARLARAHDAFFVDLFSVFQGLGEPAPRSRAKTRPASAYTDNGIHLNERGYRIAGEAIRRAMQPAIPGTPSLRLSLSGPALLRQEGCKATDIQAAAGGLQFTARWDQLGLPSASISISIEGLKSGAHVLRVDGEDVAAGKAGSWEKGLEVAGGPWGRQAEALRAAIVKKNELFFHRWRPENSTYLFLFRKGEQGRNAKEIPEFDPLIAEQERMIAELRGPKAHRCEIVPAPRDYVFKPAPRPSSPQPKGSPQTPQPRPSFELAPGLVANLYAENPLLHKPIHMNFDAQGRLWIASSSVYPQIKPGQSADDTIIVVEDRDGDGVAETSRVFADGLLIPTGVEPGDGGVYVGQSTELLHFKDTDGDGRADQRRTVLSGFGTEDTHHILHTLHWGMDGQLYMNQSIYIHTHAETPSGVQRLNSGGILNLRPSTLELGVHMKGLVNSWGHQMDLYGQSFATDGAGGEGINYVVPQAMYFTYAGARRILGSVSPGSYPKFCGLEILHSPAFPDDWQGSMITCDFRAHRVVRFAIREQGSAYVTQEMPDLVRSQDATFRPIDVKLGPDGALYIADWSNPIIQHGEVDFRDPRRDKEHGRIWRVTHKDHRPIAKTDLAKARTPELLAMLTGASGFHREKARRVLAERGATEVTPSLKKWMANASDERAQLEALWLHQSLDVVNTPLLERLLQASDGRVRAAAVRVLAFWGHRLAAPGHDLSSRTERFLKPEQLTSSQKQRPLELLAKAVADEHPRVRLEALRALPRFPGARAAEVALSALDRPLDKHLDYAVWLTINDLAEPWIAAIKSGDWKIEGREKQLEYGLKALEPAQAGAVLGQILARRPFDKEGSGNWIELAGQSGLSAELSNLYGRVRDGGFSATAAARALTALAEAARLRNARPEGDLAAVSSLFAHTDLNVRKSAIRLAGAWKIPGEKLAPLAGIAGDPATPEDLRSAIFETLREIGGAAAERLLTPLCEPGSSLVVRRQAIPALASMRLDAGIRQAVQALPTIASEPDALGLWRSLLSIKGAAASLTRQLPKSGIPASVARAGLRAARESGRNEPDLVLALTRGADLSEGEATLSDAELKSMATTAASQGDARRGESIYRRAQLGCVQCHSIGGAGGKVGPDLTSIGASAPMDYLIESVWFPNRKVKEGFHSTLIETKDGQDLSGLLVRESGEQIVLRDTQGGEFSVAKNNVANRRNGGSLMPAGLIDGVAAQERLDLFRFLSELGKPGPFDASKGSVARGWKLRPGLHQDEQFGLERMVATPLSAPGWISAWSWVDGRVPQEELRQAASVQKYVGIVGVYAATQLQAPVAGKINLRAEGAAGASVWIGGKPATLAADGSVSAEVAAGTHEILIRLDPRKLPEFLRLSTSDGTFIMP